jgi:hypothetical protein
VLTTIVAVLGTLMGSVVTGTLQNIAASRAERTAAVAQLRRDRLDTIVQLTAAAADYRRAMRRRGQARVSQASPEQNEQLRRDSHAMRAAITQPMTMLKVLISDAEINAAARAMVDAAYRIKECGDAAAVSAAQEVARAAQDTFVELAARYVADGPGALESRSKRRRAFLG